MIFSSLQEKRTEAQKGLRVRGDNMLWGAACENCWTEKHLGSGYRTAWSGGTLAGEKWEIST